MPQIATETPESYGARKNQALSFAEFQSRMQQGKNAAQIANEQAQKSRESTQPAAGKPTGEELIQPIKTTQNTGAATPQSRFTRQLPFQGSQTPQSRFTRQLPFQGSQTPQSPAATAPLTQGSLAGEGRSAEQIQQEISDRRKRLAKLQSDAAYVLTAEPGAELGRQMDAERARIKALNEELNALNAPNTNAERDSLIQRMNAITENEGYATTVELADAVTQEKQDTRQRLHQLDEELGNAARFYDSGERAGAVTKGALKQTGSAYTNFMGTLQGMGNRLNELSPDENAALYGIDYGELEKEEQRLYEKADTMSDSASRDIEQAKEGLSALGQAGVDISTNLIQLGIDAAGKAAGLGMLPFFVRAAGGSMQEARQAGASTGQQLAYGLTKGGIEAATEILTGGIAGTGISGLDNVIEPLIDKLVKSTAGRIALKAISNAAGEGIEEGLSDILDPFAKLIYNDRALKEAWENRADLGAQMLYDFLIGLAVGSIGSGTKIAKGAATGQYAEKNGLPGGTETPVQPVQTTQSTPARPVMDTAENLTGIPGPVQQTGQGNNAPLQQNIDNGGTTAYNNTRITNGGAEDGIRTAGLQQDDAGRSAEANRRGIPGVYQYSNSDNSGWGRSGEVPVGTGFVLISENARKRLNERGVAVVEARDASSDKAAFSSALESARANDPDNGWAVTPKSAEELEQSGARLLMDERGSAGLAVTPDGDIEAVFANHAAGAPKGATKSLIPMAIANGGTKLDCYGIDLVKLYAQYGFTPVARVKFDPEYANPGWDSSKGTPDIYFMMHNGDSADSVVDKIGTYPIPTAAELQALPEMDYDSAYAYRDRLLAERSGKGSPLGGAVERSETEGKGSPFGGAVERSETEGKGSPFGGAVEQSETEGVNAAGKTQADTALREYQIRIADAIQAKDYQRACELYREYQNPYLREFKDFLAVKEFTEYADAHGYGLRPVTAVGMDGAKNTDKDVSNQLNSLEKSQQEEYNSSERSINSLSLRFMSKRDSAYINLQNVPPLDGYEDIACHADPLSFGFVDPVTGETVQDVDARFLAKLVIESGKYNGGAIRLIACEAGKYEDGIAQKFADEMGVNVLAPTKEVYVDTMGYMVVADDDAVATELLKTATEKWNPEGWKTFKPRER